MTFYFDYIYYRFYKVFYKWDGEEGNRALLSITAIQTMLVFDLAYLIMRVLYSPDVLKPYAKGIGISVICLGIAIYVRNYRIYTGRYHFLHEHWKHESRAIGFYKGLLIFASILFPILLVYLIDYIT